MEHIKIQKDFPIATRRKPDIFLWCKERKIIELIELTVPYEDNIDSAADRKDERYQVLLDACEVAGWQAAHYPIEVGGRGYTVHRLRSWLLSISLCHQEANTIMKNVSETAEKASHWIWLK